jgi:hypothetical protein
MKASIVLSINVARRPVSCKRQGAENVIGINSIMGCIARDVLVNNFVQIENVSAGSIGKTGMKKLAIAAIATVLMATGASAEVLVCERDYLSGNGFRNKVYAEQTFPVETVYIIEGDEVVDSTYGPGKVVRDGKKVKLYFEFDSGWSVRTVFFTSNGTYSSNLGGQAGYQTTNGAKGKCAVQ